MEILIVIKTLDITFNMCLQECKQKRHENRLARDPEEFEVYKEPDGCTGGTKEQWQFTGGKQNQEQTLNNDETPKVKANSLKIEEVNDQQ